LNSVEINSNYNISYKNEDLIWAEISNLHIDFLVLSEESSEDSFRTEEDFNIEDTEEDHGIEEK
jgi:hypothetical protein